MYVRNKEIALVSKIPFRFLKGILLVIILWQMSSLFYSWIIASSFV